MKIEWKMFELLLWNGKRKTCFFVVKLNIQKGEFTIAVTFKLRKFDQMPKIPLVLNKNLLCLHYFTLFCKTFQFFFAMQLSKVHIILFLSQFLFSTILSLNNQLTIVKKCLPSESFMDITYIINRNINSDQNQSDLVIDLGENMTVFQSRR